MLARTDLRGRTPSTAELRAALPRGGVDVDAVLHQVRPMVEAVRDRGAEAALEFGEKFDGVRPASVRVPAAELERALRELDPAVKEALEVAIERTRTVHADQRRKDTVTEVVPGGTVTERWVPVERVGLYVPGGNAVYPSSVVMNVVPAQTAGVGSLVVASPPQADFGGLPHPTILAAAAMLGVDEVAAGRASPSLPTAEPTPMEPSLSRSTSSPVPATSTSLPPSVCAADWSASTRKPVPPRSRSSPTTPLTRSTLPPISSARPSTT